MKHIFFISVLLFAQLTFAREKILTMEDCIRYAVEHNLQRTKQEAQNKIYKINRQEAVAGFLPSLTAETSIYNRFGRGLDPETNAYISTNTFSSGYDIYSSMTLSAKQSLKATETEYKIARGRLFPTLSLGAGFSTGFSRLMDGSPYMSFSEQLKTRQGSYIGVSLSIPLFDRLSRSSESRRAKQRLIIAQSEYEATLRQIYSEIEQAIADVRGLQDEIRSAHEKTVAMLEAHKVNTRKYNEGLISAIELATSTNRLLNARVEELHTNLKYQLKCKLLNYYKGETSWIEF
jgi:outer membrane protein TolC